MVFEADEVQDTTFPLCIMLMLILRLSRETAADPDGHSWREAFCVGCMLVWERSLLNVMNVELGEKPFACDAC